MKIKLFIHICYVFFIKLIYKKYNFYLYYTKIETWFLLKLQ
uniref:Uncharacterized protein n=1 Tax=viral metagenome TaxID=1070528 RepID=A0A6C0I728_9ZZZZ